MSHSLDKEVGSDAPTKDEEQTDSTAFTLSIVSPSVEVASPLTFPHLLASTTVQELKAKIRDVIPSKPTEGTQRLIHRGRMLDRGSQTMLEVFGQESLSTPHTHTLHLVLRPSPLPDDSQLNNAPTITASDRSRLGLPSPPSLNFPPRSTPPLGLTPGAQGESPRQIPAYQPLQHHHHLHAEHTQNIMTERLQQLQRETERLQQEIEAGARAYQSQLGRLMNNVGNLTPATPNRFQPSTSLQQLIAQQQQRRAAEGLQGAQDRRRPNPFTSIDDGSSSNRQTPSSRNPDHSTTYTREGVGPNGERWHVTVNETTTTIPAFHSHHQNSNNGQNGGEPAQAGTNPAVDLRDMMRNVDRLMASRNPQNRGQRSLSNPPTATAEAQVSLSNAPPPAATSTPSSPPSTVLLNPAATASAPNLTAAPTISATAAAPSPLIDPMVYILSSPSGPRALLVNNSQTFYTPRLSRARQNNGAGQMNGHGGQPISLPEYRNRARQRGAPRRNRLNEDAPVELPPIHNGAARPAPPFLIQLFNVLWLVARLVAFVWFFTSGHNSWSRFFMITGLALLVFVINTGVFTGVFHSIAEQLLGPIRRHLENLIPLAGPDAALVPAANAVVIPQNAAANTNNQTRLPNGQLDEAQVAARLIEQRRQANESWILTQIRRAEHAALLFVASLIPGVGERHIAHRDNAAREAEAAAAAAERQRVEAENAANEPSAGSAENASDTVLVGDPEHRSEAIAAAAVDHLESPRGQRSGSNSATHGSASDDENANGAENQEPSSFLQRPLGPTPDTIQT